LVEYLLGLRNILCS